MDPEQTLRSLQQKAFYPFTFPVTSGPGTLVVVLTLSARFSGGKLTPNILGHLGLFLAVIVLSALVYLCYGYAPKIKAAVAPTTIHGILRIIAFIASLASVIAFGWSQGKHDGNIVETSDLGHHVIAPVTGTVSKSPSAFTLQLHHSI